MKNIEMNDFSRQINVLNPEEFNTRINIMVVVQLALGRFFTCKNGITKLTYI